MAKSIRICEDYNYMIRQFFEVEAPFAFEILQC